MNNAKFIDETGNKYGKLTVIAREQNTICGTAQWLCKCECGNTKISRGQDLRSGRTTHCGCENKSKRITNYFKIKNMSIDEMALWITLNIHKALNDFAEMTDTSSKQYELDTEKYVKMIKQYLLQEVEE